jgi:two-component system response regulator AtoC
MLAVYKGIAHAADSSASVLLIGESGVGKELVARAIHDHCPRSREAFVGINCGAIAESLLESELFGHTRGAFTGAVADHEGVFEQAGGGSVLLDEIGDTTPAMQVRLLRVLEENEVRPVGGTRSIKVAARIIAATNVPLEQMVEDGRFRSDLYYRLSVVVIRVPPLRERRADIPLLIQHFLDDACARAGQRKRLSAEALDALLGHRWPGNVRELRNTIERIVASCRGTLIEAVDLPDAISKSGHHESDQPFADLPTLDDLESRYLRHVLEAVSGNRTRAAEIMGVDQADALSHGRALRHRVEGIAEDLRTMPRTHRLDAGLSIVLGALTIRSLIARVKGANRRGGVDANIGDAKREGHVRGHAAVPVGHMAARLGDVNAGIRGTQRHMCQQLHETVIVVIYLDPNTPP